MKLSESLSPARIKVPLEATEKRAAITELVDLLVQNNGSVERDKLLTAVMEREAQRSTGIGQGFAVPHAKTDAVKNLSIAIGRCREPIEFDAVDGAPVRLIALLASPTHATSLHIQALAKLTRLVTNAAVREQLFGADSAAALFEVISTHDKE